MTFQRYTIALEHDSGKATITVAAPDLATAIRRVLASEKAPANAIRRIVREPDPVLHRVGDRAHVEGQRPLTQFCP